MAKPQPQRAKQRDDDPPIVDHAIANSKNPADNPRSHGHKHPAAFSVVSYKAESGRTEELWNAWDGPPPLHIKLLDTGEIAQCTYTAVYMPGYVPAVGERIGVPLTLVRARVRVLEGLDRYLADDSDPEFKAKIEANFDSKEDLTMATVAELMSKDNGDELIVTNGYLEELHQARAAGMLSQHSTARYESLQPAAAPDAGAAGAAPDAGAGPLRDALDSALLYAGCTLGHHGDVALPPHSKIVHVIAGIVHGRAVMLTGVLGPAVSTGQPAGVVLYTGAARGVRAYMTPIPSEDNVRLMQRVGMDVLQQFGVKFFDIPDLRERLTRDAELHVGRYSKVRSATLEALRAAKQKLRDAAAAAGAADAAGGAADFMARAHAALQAVGLNSDAPPTTSPKTARLLCRHALVPATFEVEELNTVIISTAFEHGRYEIVAANGQAWVLSRLFPSNTTATSARARHDAIVDTVAQAVRGVHIELRPDDSGVPV
jgi:hypothetical protein